MADPPERQSYFKERVCSEAAHSGTELRTIPTPSRRPDDEMDHRRLEVETWISGAALILTLLAFGGFLVTFGATLEDRWRTPLGLVAAVVFPHLRSRSLHRLAALGGGSRAAIQTGEGSRHDVQIGTLGRPASAEDGPAALARRVTARSGVSAITDRQIRDLEARRTTTYLPTRTRGSTGSCSSPWAVIV